MDSLDKEEKIEEVQIIDIKYPCSVTCHSIEDPHFNENKEEKIEDETQQQSCRFCLEYDISDSPTNLMLTPCKCTGSQKYVHSNCLEAYCFYGNEKCLDCESDVTWIFNKQQSSPPK